MQKIHSRVVLVGLLLALARADALGAPALHVAVAANFLQTAEALGKAYREQTGVETAWTPGSSGALYAQIVQGAPFDLFLSADTERPQRLEARGQAIEGSLFVYAVGALALWSAHPALVDTEGGVLRTGAFSRLAIADPKVAPYGAAAATVLNARGLYTQLENRLVIGQTIGQTFRYAASGQADLGFVALAQVITLPEDRRGSIWIVPSDLYPPIRQAAVLLRDRPEARAFLDWLQSDPEARAIVRRFGYREADAP